MLGLETRVESQLQVNTLRCGVGMAVVGSLLVAPLGWAWWPERMIPSFVWSPMLFQVLSLVVWLAVPWLTGWLTASWTVGDASVRVYQGGLAGVFAALGSVLSPLMLGLMAFSCRGWVATAERMDVAGAVSWMCLATLRNLFFSGALVMVLSVVFGLVLGRLGAAMNGGTPRDGSPKLLHPAAWVWGAFMGCLVSSLSIIAVVTVLMSFASSVVGMDGVSGMLRAGFLASELFWLGLVAVPLLLSVKVLWSGWTRWTQADRDERVDWFDHGMAGVDGWILGVFWIVLSTWPVIFFGLAAALISVGLIVPFTEEVALGPDTLTRLDDSMEIIVSFSSPVLSSLLSFLPIALCMMVAQRLVEGVARRRAGE
jgi:hypothetical protein